MAKPSALLQALLLLAAASAEAGEDAGGLLWVDAQPAQTWASGALRTCESCVNSDFALSSGQCVYCPVRWGFNAWEGNCYYPCPSTHPIFAMGRCYGCKAGMYISPAIPVPTSTSAPWHGHDDDDDGHDDDDGGPGGGLSPSPSARPDSALDGASSSSGDSTLPWLG
ncbi:hypothetical protein FNF28_03752 [Cafeteria roenbergensis]|uniref:Tyrosine-protein kinase ephrin type A/B receptor-like domain-containing protein n=1 Tax=Cafeteria roenbergensis TaxID=33653 RepID=A0A5A8DGF9_CAFRO|nr:hypothetical protein FNF28_03752 [Cafeteria roenbergensis]